MLMKNQALTSEGVNSSPISSSLSENSGSGRLPMPVRLVALEEGPDIFLDRAMMVVGRHPTCDARLDSIRVSRRHCCMTQDNGEVVVRDLGSTNGIRINGQRVEMGRLRPGDELSIAHIRYRLETAQGHEMTLVEALKGREDGHHSPYQVRPSSAPTPPAENALAAAVRDLLPSAVADRCRIQVIVQMPPDAAAQAQEPPDPCRPDSSP
jgi:predicted component of type VI protein secretion system